MTRINLNGIEDVIGSVNEAVDKITDLQAPDFVSDVVALANTLVSRLPEPDPELRRARATARLVTRLSTLAARVRELAREGKRIPPQVAGRLAGQIVEARLLGVDVADVLGLIDLVEGSGRPA